MSWEKPTRTGLKKSFINAAIFAISGSLSAVISSWLSCYWESLIEGCYFPWMDLVSNSPTIAWVGSIGGGITGIISTFRKKANLIIKVSLFWAFLFFCSSLLTSPTSEKEIFLTVIRGALFGFFLGVLVRFFEK